MSLPILFQKATAARFIESIKNNQPLHFSGDGWTWNEMAILAGTLHFATLSHGPFLHQGVDYGMLSKERQEAISEQFQIELQQLILLYSDLAMAIADDEYDASYLPSIRGVLDDEDGRPKIRLASNRVS